jgi:hypothetical protein
MRITAATIRGGQHELLIADEAAVIRELVRECGCPLKAAVGHPEHRGALMRLNAERELRRPTMSDAAGNRVRRALESVLRARTRASARVS